MSAEKCPECGASVVPMFPDSFKCGAEIDMLTGQFFPTLTCVARREARNELIAELTATKRKLTEALADAASWQQQADARLNDAVEFVRRAEKAEARVKELEKAEEAELSKALTELEEAGKRLKDDPQFEEDCQADMKLEKDLAELAQLRERVKELEGLVCVFSGYETAINVIPSVLIPRDRVVEHDEPTTLGEAVPRRET